MQQRRAASALQCIMATITSPAGRARVTGQTLIPGAYEQRPLVARRSGSMSGPAFGSPDMPVGPTPMDAATIAERQKEGGGAADQRRKPLVHGKKRRLSFPWWFRSSGR